MHNKFHPAKSSRVLSLGLSTSALFGMVTAFTWNQLNADQQAIADQKFANEIAAAQAQADQVQPANSGIVVKKNSSTATNTTKTVPNVEQQTTATSIEDTTVGQPEPAAVAPAVAPAPVTVTQPDPVVIAPAPDTPAPASNTTSGGSK